MVQVPLDLLLQQAKVQIFQRIRTQAGRVVGPVFCDERDGLQVARDFLEVARVEAIDAQCLEQE